MPRSALLLILMFGYIGLSAQNISVTFTGTGASTRIDSVNATNLSTGQSVTLPGDQMLVLAGSTGVPDISEFSGQGIVYPNPFSGQATFITSVREPQTVYIAIHNLVGQVIAEVQTFVQSGKIRFSLTLAHAGIYYVVLITNSKTDSYKIICTEPSGGESGIIYLGMESGNSDGLFNQTHPERKSSPTNYTLGFKKDDVILFRCMSGAQTTIKTDSPEASVNYLIEFAECADPDGRRYAIVGIGDQIWMAENLAYLPRLDSISRFSDSSPCFYVNEYLGTDIGNAMVNEHYKTYGVLYNWPAAAAVCPVGWHLPTDNEWAILENYLGMSPLEIYNQGSRHSGAVAEKLKSTTGWGENSRGNNITGFTALPGGYFWTTDGYFIGLGVGSSFWTASPSPGSGESVFYRGMGNDLFRDTERKREGLSVRCLKNCSNSITPPEAGFTISPTHGTSATIFRFDPTGCTDLETASPDLQIRWDWDGDGTWDTAFDTPKTNSFQYSLTGGFSVIMEVRDGQGLSDIATSMVFISDSTFTDARDGHEYAFKTIGSQVWMIENLAYLPSVNPPADGSGSDPYFYVQGYAGSDPREARLAPDFLTYGTLYNWEAAKTACPAGWHLPSDAEWAILSEGNSIQNLIIGGSALWRDISLGTNRSGFTAIPGGIREYYGRMSQLNHFAFFWSVSEIDSSTAYGRTIGPYDQAAYQDPAYKSSGRSVRCLRGITPTSPSANMAISPTHGIPATLFQFDASASRDRETATDDLEVRWDLNGDGAWDSDFGKNLSGSFQSPRKGDFPVKMEIRDESGLTDIETKVLTVSEGTFIDSRDGRQYVYATIGTQRWMAENLAYLPSVSPSSAVSGTAPLFYVFGYEGSDVDEAMKHQNYSTYGVLYNWPAATAGDSSKYSDPIGLQGVCPAGWHLPSAEEWVVLRDYLGPEAEKELKSYSGWGRTWVGEDARGDNSTGFNAFPDYSGADRATFWSSSVAGSFSAWTQSLGLFPNTDYGGHGFAPWEFERSYRSAVRCVSDNSRRTAAFTVHPAVGTTSTLFQFDASGGSRTSFASGVCQLRWDWNGDGIWDTRYDTVNIRAIRFPEPGNYPVILELIDSSGFASTESRLVVVGDGTMNDNRDGRDYVFKTIGTQTWMLENLAWLPSVWPSGSVSDTIPYYYVYDFEGSNANQAKDARNYDTYGTLYNWRAAITACPSGWHLPRDEEWAVLEGYLGDYAGKKMKSNYGWFDKLNGDNSSGFSALPGGSVNTDMEFYGLGEQAIFWSATGADFSGALAAILTYYNDYLNRNQWVRMAGFSVRCLKNGLTNPVANFSVVPARGALTTHFRFDASESYDIETNPFDLQFRWDWNGDGTWDTGYEKSRTAYHQFQDQGTFSVILEVKDGDGTVASFTGPVTVLEGIVTDSRDGHGYFYATIGTQVWMIENLAFLPIISPSSTDSGTEKLYHVYKYQGTSISEAKESANYKTYGVLYNWPAAMNGEAGSTSNPSGVQGACPAGWHLPGDAEWTVLTDFLGPAAGKVMKTSAGWSTGNGDNSSGFSTLPGGYRNLSGGFAYLSKNAWFWSASADGPENALVRYLDGYFDGVVRETKSRGYGYSVRCLRD